MPQNVKPKLNMLKMQMWGCFPKDVVALRGNEKLDGPTMLLQN